MGLQAIGEQHGPVVRGSEGAVSQVQLSIRLGEGEAEVPLPSRLGGGRGRDGQGERTSLGEGFGERFFADVPMGEVTLGSLQLDGDLPAQGGEGEGSEEVSMAGGKRHSRGTLGDWRRGREGEGEGADSAGWRRGGCGRGQGEGLSEPAFGGGVGLGGG
jgi:hypothetical protein